MDSRGTAGLWMRGGSGSPGRGSGGKESRSHKGGTAGTDSHMSQISRRGVGVGCSRSRAVGSRLFGAPFWLLLLGALVPALSRVPPRPLLAFAPGRQKMPLDHVALDPCQMPTDCFAESESLPPTPQGEISSTEPSFGGGEKRHTEIRRSGMRRSPTVRNRLSEASYGWRTAKAPAKGIRRLDSEYRACPNAAADKVYTAIQTQLYPGYGF